MGKEVTSMPNAIRKAGKSISSLKAENRCEGLADAITSSDGLTAEGINLLLQKIKSIDSLLDSILIELPKKLESVATLIEAGDNTAASQFK